MIRLAFLALLFVFAGCTTVVYNEKGDYRRLIDRPASGEITTRFVGDYLLEKGVVNEYKVLRVLEPINGAPYYIPAGTYKKLGFNDGQHFYTVVGVTKYGLADPLLALMTEANSSKICAITTLGLKHCYPGRFKEEMQLSESAANFQQKLIYNGRVGSKINIGYREFNKGFARPAFSNDAEYDFNISNKIGYKGALLEIISADNRVITYRVINNFP